MAHVEHKDANCCARWKDEFDKWRFKKIGRHTEARHRDTLKAAIRLEDEARDRKYSGPPPEPKKTPMSALIDRYRGYVLTRKSLSTVQTEEFRYPRLLKAFPENVQDVTRGAIEDYMTTRRAQGAAAATVNNEFSLISHMFTKAKDWGYITHDPTKGIEKFTDTVERDRFLMPDEFRRLMKELNSKIKDIILAKLYLALRMSNILNLTWEQVDFDRELIIIPKTKNKKPLVQPMIEPLKVLLQELPRTSTYVFPGNDGKPYKRIIKGFRAACQRAGIVDFRPHDLRHTFGTHLIANGCDIRTLQELLGHKTLRMTMRYVQVITENKRRSMNIIGELFHADDTDGTDGQ
jgi:integrase